MTRKDYKLFADLIREIKGFDNRWPCISLCLDAFKRDNPKFDYEKFIRACQPKELISVEPISIELMRLSGNKSKKRIENDRACQPIEDSAVRLSDRDEAAVLASADNPPPPNKAALLAASLQKNKLKNWII